MFDRCEVMGSTNFSINLENSMPKFKKPIMGSCSACGLGGRKVRYLEFHQRISVILVGFDQQVAGNICGECSRRYFWKFSGVTLLAGWWSLSGLLMTPAYLLVNTINYFQSLVLRRGNAVAVPKE